MALRAQKGDLPANAIRLTRTEAIKYQWELIHEWKPQREVWPFTRGIGLLGGLAALSGVYINMKFRQSMKMRNFGGAVSTFTVALCTGAMTCLLHTHLVAGEVLLPIDTCAKCVELRSIFVQNGNAIVYPLILAPLTNFMLAIRGQTHRIPHYKNWRELLSFYGLLCKPIIPTLGVLGIINTIAASFIVYKQFSCISYIERALTLNEASDESSKMDRSF